MKIQNVDVSIELARKALDCVPFVLDVISVCQPCRVDAEQAIGVSNDQLPIEPIWKLHAHSYDDVANMIHQFPIYLVKGQGGEYPEDLLGAYLTSNGNTSPYIKLYVEKIEYASSNDAKQFKWLFTKVLLHEVMHAIMDVYNQVGFAGRETDLGRDEYRKWREESYANGGALWIIHEYAKCNPSQENDDFVKYVENFMTVNQADGYKLGLKVADFPVRNMRHWIDEKMNGNLTQAEREHWLSQLSETEKRNFSK